MSSKKNENILIDSSLSLNNENIYNSINGNENQNFYNDNVYNRYNGYNNIYSNKNKSSKNFKKVKFIESPKIIDVECWKKYNLEQTADENFEDYLEEIQNNEKNNNQNKKDKQNKQKNKSKSDTITCTCNII